MSFENAKVAERPQQGLYILLEGNRLPTSAWTPKWVCEEREGEFLNSTTNMFD